MYTNLVTPFLKWLHCTGWQHRPRHRFAGVLCVLCRYRNCSKVWQRWLCVSVEFHTGKCSRTKSDRFKYECDWGTRTIRVRVQVRLENAYVRLESNFSAARVLFWYECDSRTSTSAIGVRDEEAMQTYMKTLSPDQWYSKTSTSIRDKSLPWMLATLDLSRAKTTGFKLAASTEGSPEKIKLERKS